MVNLYRFVHSNTVYTWTNVSHTIEYNGDLYLPETIGRGSIEQSNEHNRSTLSVTIPRTNPLGAAFIAQPQDWPVSFTLYELKDGSISTIWIGSVNSHGASGSEVTLDCINAKASQRRSGNYARCQKTCRYALYQRGCNLVAANFASAGVCTSVDGTTAVVTEAASLPSGDLIGGMIEYNGVQKYIKNHVGDTLTMMYPFKSLSDAVDGGAKSITLYPGCAHNFTTCLVKFNNLDNFGGFPWIPNINPFTAVSIY